MKKLFPLAAVFLGFASLTYAAGKAVEINPPAEGSVSIKQGLEHWARVYEVLSHPRCSNCHVGADNRPMWSGPNYGKTRKHGMAINAGESRIGAEYIMCNTCHTAGNNVLPHGAPGVDAQWQLAPVEAEWFGKSTSYICNQIKDPARNGDRTYLELAEHLDHDQILHWAWAPGAGREPAPYSLQENVNDILAWGVAGMPCPTE